MKLRKFFGSTSREVLQQVRKELGSDAVIVANRGVDNGIEITALASEGLEAMLEDTPPRGTRIPAARPAEPRPPTVRQQVAETTMAPVASEISTSAGPIDVHLTSAPRRRARPRLLQATNRQAMNSQVAPGDARNNDDSAAEPPVLPLEQIVLRPVQFATVSVPLAARVSAPLTATVSAPLAATMSPPMAATATPPLAPPISAPLAATVSPPLAETEPAQQPMPASVAKPSGAPGLGTRLMSEVSSLRGLLQDQLAQLAWNDTLRSKPLRARITRDLLASGYSAQLARDLAQRVPDDCELSQIADWLTRTIARELPCADPSDDIIAWSGVYALVGPTGVGKTTSVAKIAARCAVRYGAQSLALLTTDSYRVGAHDQLRAFAKILGVSVHTVADGEDLRRALELFDRKQFVLIDTVGMGQRDARLIEQSKLLVHPKVQRILLLNATSQAETLEEVVCAYGAAASDRSDSLAGCIVTKLDEAARPGNALDVIIRHRLTLLYVSNGQRVPEDLHAPNAAYLAHRSLRKALEQEAGSPFALNNDEVGCVIGAEAANA